LRRGPAAPAPRGLRLHRGGADGEVSCGNCRVFDTVAFGRARLSRSRVDRTTVLGTLIAMPLIFAPVGSSRLFYPRGEEVAARVADQWD
jgi:isopentenyl diphosphate isomerase/L-lactate dehydrogenase-like FMN-dependent dehydrogenase